MTPVAFYAPLKSPDHPEPSGDRAMGRLLMAALRVAGYAPAIASRLRSRESAGDAARQAAIRDEGRAETDRLVAHYRDLPPEGAPRLWFTYHNYYKAPDHVGPEVSRRLGIPYVVAEASHASKRARGPWAPAHRAAEAAIEAADLLFCLTGNDREALARSPDWRRKLVDLPPFVDLSSPCGMDVAVEERPSGGPARLLAVAMMRPGDKLASYRLLADALERIRDLDWTLAIVGDGPARAETEVAFAGLRDRVAFRGQLDGEALRRAYADCDIVVWPAVNEAYGMALLEAQAMGRPVVAGAFGGVADAMRPGETGLLTRPGDADDFALAAAALIRDPPRITRMGEAAREFVRSERDLGRAATVLRLTLAPLVAVPA